VRGSSRVPARVFEPGQVRLSVIFRNQHIAVEDNTRPPVPLTLKPPTSPRRYLGLGASLALHGVLLALLVMRGEQLFSRTLAPGTPALGPATSESGGGGSRVAYITLPPMPRTEPPPPRPKIVKAVPPPRKVETPVRAPEEPEVVTPPPPDTVATSSTQTLAASDSGSARGAAPGAGAGGQPGQGSGTSGGGGNGVGPGEGGRARPPEPRDMAFPFDNPPKELRGTSLNVTFWVRIDGRVERYVVEPAIKDRDYAKKFDEVMRAFRFTPARAADGRRIPGTTRISFTLPGKSSS
jgi:hypothetical protein